jgi:hypothetical protein
MSVANLAIDARARSVRVARGVLSVSLADGRELRVPLTWLDPVGAKDEGSYNGGFPRLAAGTPGQQANYRIVEGGRAINWPDLDEDIGIAPLLATPS